jgi:hypothetical protein
MQYLVDETLCSQAHLPSSSITISNCVGHFGMFERFASDIAAISRLQLSRTFHNAKSCLLSETNRTKNYMFTTLFHTLSVDAKRKSA